MTPTTTKPGTTVWIELSGDAEAARGAKRAAALILRLQDLHRSSDQDRTGRCFEHAERDFRELLGIDDPSLSMQGIIRTLVAYVWNAGEAVDNEALMRDHEIERRASLEGFPEGWAETLAPESVRL